jgi:hypothetical protein
MQGVSGSNPLRSTSLILNGLGRVYTKVGSTPKFGFFWQHLGNIRKGVFFSGLQPRCVEGCPFTDPNHQVVITSRSFRVTPRNL